MTMLGELQSLNASAVHAINKEEYQDAVDVLRVMLSRLSGCVLDPTPFPTREGSSFSTSTGAIAHQGSCSLVIQEFQTIKDFPSAINGDFSFYPFVVESPKAGDDNDASLSELEHAIFTVSALFNLGLCFHLEWIKCDKLHAYLLHGALHYYEEAYGIARDHLQLLKSDDQILRVLLALCTNAAHCHSELAHTPLVLFWCTQIQRILSFAKPHMRSDFFKRVAFFYSMPSLSAPAA